MPTDPRCIGVFDSGIGGLTVVRELRRRLPGEDIIYFGDTARVPYGAKSSETVTRFARENCDFLLRFDPKIIVVACNTASAAAMPELEAVLPVPCCGVVKPGAREAVRLSEGRTIAVIATEATVASNAYISAIRQYAKNAFVLQHACPLFVPIVEEGRMCTDPIVLAVAHNYLDSIAKLGPKVLVMGCTHYPLLRDAIAAVMGDGVQMVDSGQQTARTVVERMESMGLLNDPDRTGSLHCYVSDNPQRFQSLGQRFLGHPVVDVTWIAPEQFYSPASPVGWQS